VEFVAGRRRTSAAALALVRRSLADVNAQLAASLGPVALPLPDGVLDATPIAGLGLVGDPVASAPGVLVEALAVGLVPVVAPLARDGEGRTLNVNGDEAAVALALGLRADRIVFASDVPGVFLDGAVAPALGAAEAERLAGGWEGGIVPKLLAAARAARHGVAAEIGATAVTA
jgi:acetylglutamate kinase